MNINNIDFIRQTLHSRITRPQVTLAVYPDIQSGSTKPQISISSTTITVKYGSTQEQVLFVGKSVEQVAADINRTSIPVKCVALSSSLSLSSGDFIQTSGFLTIPDGFNVYDRLTDGGVAIRSTKWTVKYNDTAKIRLLPPYNDSYTLPWYPRISVGAFSQDYRGRKFNFYIPEYNLQTWSALYGMPFKDLKSAAVSVKDTNLLQLPRYPIHWNGDNLIFYNDGSPLSNFIIEDIDVNNGLVYIKPGSFPNGNITVDYTYLENNFIYPYLNINAHFNQNPSLIDKFVVFYLLPAEGTIAVKNNRTVYHKIADNLQEAIDSIEIENSDIPIAIIGAYAIQQVLSSDRVTILDTRVLGGGLVGEDLKSPVHIVDTVFTLNTDSKVKPIEDTYVDAKSFWDIGNYDGEPYPGAASVVIKVPDYLKDAHSSSTIKSKVSKFISAGVYPILDYYPDYTGYVDGFSDDISLLDNPNFSGNFSGIYGSYWVPSNRSIPSGTVLTYWEDQINSNVLVKSLDNKFYLESSPHTGYFQTYLKSSPNTIITWEERSVLGTGDKFSDWKTVRKIDDRAVTPGHLVKGYVGLYSPYENKQYRDVSIFSPYLRKDPDTFKSEIEQEVLTIMSGVAALAGPSGERPLVGSITNIVNGWTGVAQGYYGMPEQYIPVLKLAVESPELLTTGILSFVNNIVSGYSSGYDSSYISKYYNPANGSYSQISVNNPFTVTPHLTNLAYCLNYAKINLTGLYPTLYTDVKNILSKLYGSNIGQTYISPKYYLDGSSDPASFARYPLNIPAYLDVNPVFEDHRITELLPSIVLSIQGFPNYNSSSLTGYTGLMRLVTDTINTAVGRLPSSIYRQKYNSGDAVANSWYAPFDRYGEYLGTLSNDIINTYENLFSIYKANTKEPGYTGFSINYLIGYLDGLKTVLDHGYSGFFETISRGGILDKKVSKLLYAYGWYAHKALDAEGAIDNIANKLLSADYSGYHTLFIEGLRLYTKSIIREDGAIAEIDTVDQDHLPVEGTPPLEIFDSLKLNYIKENELGLLQGVFTNTTGQWSYNGYYPDSTLDTNLSGNFAPQLASKFIDMRKPFTGYAIDEWEPIYQDYSNVRGINFTPVYTEYLYLTPENLFSGAANTTSQWRFFRTGSTDTQLGYLRGMGFNSIRLFCALHMYEYHRLLGQTGDSNPFIQSYKEFLTLAKNNHIKVMPVLFDGTALCTNPVGEPYNFLYNWVSMPHSSYRTSAWYTATGQYYVRDIVVASTGYNNILMFDVANEMDPVAASGLIKSTIDGIKAITPDIPVTVGYAASVHRPGSFFTNWSLSYSGLDVVSYHPYGVFKEVFDSFTDLAKESANGKPLIITEFGGPTNAQLPQDVCLYAIATGVGYMFYNNVVAPPHFNQILNNLGGVIFYDGEIMNSKTVEEIQTHARRQRAPTGSFRSYTQKSNLEPYGFSPFLPTYSGRDFVSFFQTWHDQPLLNATPDAQKGRLYLFKKHHLNTCLTDLNFLVDGIYGFTGSYARNYFTSGEEVTITGTLATFALRDLLGASGIASSTPAWLYDTDYTPYTVIDWDAYDSLFSGMATTIYGFITGKNLTYI